VAGTDAVREVLIVYNSKIEIKRVSAIVGRPGDEEPP
jgi:hypothetical protein